jgi:hypothetical protein
LPYREFHWSVDSPAGAVLELVATSLDFAVTVTVPLLPEVPAAGTGASCTGPLTGWSGLLAGETVRVASLTGMALNRSVDFVESGLAAAVGTPLATLAADVPPGCENDAVCTPAAAAAGAVVDFQAPLAAAIGS